MTRKQALAELIAKVEAGDDANVSSLLRMLASKARDEGNIWPSHDADKAYRGSLDAAKALHEAVLPDWYVFIKGQKGYVWFAELMDRDDNRHPQTEGETPARAWLLAILRALHSMEPDA